MENMTTETFLTVAPQAAHDCLPLWRKPTFTVLDVETGTQTNSGLHADGNGSSS